MKLKYSKKRLCDELRIFLNRNDCNHLLKYFKDNNIKFKSSKTGMIAILKYGTYKIDIIIEDNEYYWYLEPYNNSYFQTKSNLNGNFDMVLQAIKDNEELYAKKELGD